MEPDLRCLDTVWGMRLRDSNRRHNKLFRKLFYG